MTAWKGRSGVAVVYFIQRQHISSAVLNHAHVHETDFFEPFS